MKKKIKISKKILITVKYELFFILKISESMWQEYERDQWGLDPRRKMTVNDRLISTHIPKMDEEQNERESEKK